MDLAQLIEEEFLSQRVIRAMNTEDFDQLKTILKPDTPMKDFKDSNDDTLIHIAVRKKNLEILEYVLDFNLIDINTFNALGKTPLLMAVTQNSLTITRILIEKGANLNLADKEGNSPLHYTAYYNLRENCLLLLENGANVNAQNNRGFTLLHVVCGVHTDLELVAMLMYYGADVSIPSWDEVGWGYTPFELCLMHNRVQFQHFLVDFVFDGVVKVPILLGAVAGAMEHGSDLFFDIIDNVSEILFDLNELVGFMNKIVYFQPEYLRVFLQKFDYVLEGLNIVGNRIPISMCRYMEEKRDYERVIENLFVIFQEPVIPCFVENITKTLNPNVLLGLVQMSDKLKAPLEAVEGIFFHILSYGAVLTNAVLDKAYHCFGECEFFRILLFMDIQRVIVYPEWTPFPAVIYDVELEDINYYLCKPVHYSLSVFEILLDFFASVRLKERCFRSNKASLIAKAREAPDVPLLLELARNSVRNHIIRHYGISSSRQFCEIMKLLPLCEEYRSIITFKKKLYFCQLTDFS